MYLSLALVREYCNLTTEVSDQLLQLLVDSAEQRIATYLNRPLSEVLDPLSPPDIPDPQTYGAAVRHAVLLLVGDAIDNRGTQFIGVSAVELPTVERILHPYRVGLGV